jgi:hypothetical protein
MKSMLMRIGQKVMMVVVSIERCPGVLVQCRLSVAISERRLFDQELKHFCGETVVERVDKLGKVERNLWLEGSTNEIEISNPWAFSFRTIIAQA